MANVPQLVILAGGMATRLGDLTATVPKALIDIEGKPILTRILDHAAEQGVNRALILIGHLGAAFDDYEHSAVDITFYKESKPLGTGGAIWNARHLLEDEFLMIWGDDLHAIDFEPLLTTHSTEQCPLTMTVTKSHDKFNVEHHNGRVIRYDKSGVDHNGLNGYEAGTSIVQRKIVINYGREGRWSWEEEIYPELSGLIAAHLDDTPFYDMGTPEGLEELRQIFRTDGT
jgi:NDP-sugar pyrophosphorylase family protein|tara:strand:- start:1502 stop:2188 length:687 start_codon:yes stop_codon:yes gene_type:complete